MVSKMVGEMVARMDDMSEAEFSDMLGLSKAEMVVHLDEMATDFKTRIWTIGRRPLSTWQGRRARANARGSASRSRSRAAQTG